MKKRAAVIGSPIGHSLSPAIFSFVADKLKCNDFTYSAELIEPQALGDFVKTARASDDWLGCNVTTPHKQKIIEFLDEVSAEAKAIGAVNTVRFQDGRAIGFNTDVEGVATSLLIKTFPLKNALLIGAGGAARSVAYVLGKKGADTVFIQNKTLDRADELAQTMQRLFPKTQFKALNEIEDVQKMISLFVNCTPIGMEGVKPDPIVLKRIQKKFAEILKLKHPPGALAFDLIYRPERTEFLQQAEKADFQTLGGLEMLIEQALATWRIWFGPSQDAELRSLKDALRAHLRGLLKSPGVSA
jgi:shikimate dehydrogenase